MTYQTRSRQQGPTQPMLRRLARVTLVLLVLAMPIGEAAAHGPDPRSVADRSARTRSCASVGEPVRYPRARSRRPSRRAAADVRSSKASRAATFTYDAAGANPIGYGLGATCGVNGLACFTRDAPDGFTMWLREQGHVFDWGTLKWCQAYASPPNGCYDAETIALDEFGHVEGLNHHVNYTNDSDYEDAVVQTFSRTRPATGWDRHTFGRCDIATLQVQYDVTSSTAKYSTCLDVATVLTLAASPGSIPTGGSATLTATLKAGASSKLWPPERQPRWRPGHHPPAPGCRHDHLGHGRHHAGRRQRRDVRPGATAGRRHRLSSRLQDADRRGHQRQARRRPSGSMSSSRARPALPEATPSSPSHAPEPERSRAHVPLVGPRPIVGGRRRHVIDRGRPGACLRRPVSWRWLDGLAGARRDRNRRPGPPSRRARSSRRRRPRPVRRRQRSRRRTATR